MNIFPSLFSYKGDLQHYIKMIENIGVKYIHIDYLEGVTPKIQPEQLTSKLSKIPFDVHIISSSISKEEIQAYNKTKTEFLAIQYENLIDKKDLDYLNFFNGRKGIAFTTKTSMDTIVKYKGYMDYILVMCSEPGVSGASFDEKNWDVVKNIKREFPDLPIIVDGGIDKEKALKMQHLGVYAMVSGSYLANNDNHLFFSKFLEFYQYHNDTSVLFFTKKRDSVHFCSEEDDFFKLIDALEQNKNSFLPVEDENGLFVGIITDGDVKRFIIKEKEKVFECKVKDLVNRTPFSIDKSTSMRELICSRMLYGKSINVVPVVEDNTFIGLIDFNDIF